MKKNLCFLLVIMLVLNVLVGCGQTAATPEPEKEETQEPQTAETFIIPDETPTEETDLPDAAEEDDTPHFVGGFGGEAKEETYMTCTFADPYGDIRLPAISEDLSVETLPVYNMREDCGIDELKERYEEFASLIATRGEYIECRTGNEEDVYQVSLRIPNSDKEYTGTLLDMFNGSAVVIRSMKTGITIGFQAEECVGQELNHDFVLELLEKNPVIKAAYEYIGIATPELYYNHQYTTNPDYPQWADYEITEAGTDAEATAENLLLHSLGLFISDGGISINLGTNKDSKQDTRVVGMYPTVSYSKAKADFLAKYNLSEDDIIQSGFRYRNFQDPYVYIPCYEFIVKNDSIPLAEYFDPAIYAEYDLIAIPAISQ